MFQRLNPQYEGCVLIREGLVRCVSRPLWSPRSLIPFVPWKPSDTVTASGRKELSVVKMAANTCFNQPSRGLRRIEERQLVGLTGNAMVTVSTAAPNGWQQRAIRKATCLHSWRDLVHTVRVMQGCQMSTFVCFLIRALYLQLSHFTGDDSMKCWVNWAKTNSWRGAELYGRDCRRSPCKSTCLIQSL